MTRLMRGVAATLFVLLAIARPSFSQTPTLDGTWTLVAYKGGGNEGPATGQLIFDRGRFSYVYTMNEHKDRGEGRAHAGTYRVEGTDALVFVLNWDVQYVTGTGTVNRKPSESRTKMTFDGNRMTITFPNGAYQTLEKR